MENHFADEQPLKLTWNSWKQQGCKMKPQLIFDFQMGVIAAQNWVSSIITLTNYTKETSIICGVPQGTTLSPTLFNIHINQLNYLNTHGKLVCYADDTVLFVEGQPWDWDEKTYSLRQLE
ncbi:neuroblastoma-amplified sequence-like [Aphis craccivora]|uniref:Neuroblastoma-amplified sequence-like n=1 Tax=Aphis craccivora TaxID=307492 RepID=A0A6G0Z8B1_APHCR|nr:neuroblastoma-amplified sequence-like [Aphis craccivora]